jgi:hypothetical protein
MNFIHSPCVSRRLTSQISGFNRTNYIMRKVKIMKVLTVHFSAASSYSCCRPKYNNQTPVVQHLHFQGRREWVRASAEKCFVRQTRKGGPAKYLFFNSERLAVSFSVTWAWFERLNVHSRQIMILTRKIRHMYKIVGLWALFRITVPR